MLDTRLQGPRDCVRSIRSLKSFVGFFFFCLCVGKQEGLLSSLIKLPILALICPKLMPCLVIPAKINVLSVVDL